jgi:hypothetical protein
LHPGRLLRHRSLARRKCRLEVLYGPAQAINRGGHVARSRLGLIAHIDLRLPNAAAPQDKGAFSGASTSLAAEKAVDGTPRSDDCAPTDQQ